MFKSHIMVIDYWKFQTDCHCYCTGKIKKNYGISLRATVRLKYYYSVIVREASAH